MASGPSFKKHYESNIPTSNIDIVPTILHIYKLPQPATMEGRVMNELLAGNNRPLPKVSIQTITSETKKDGIIYKLSLQRSAVGNHYYVDFCKTVRVKY